MYTLISRLPMKDLLLRQAPTLLGALVIAELFYKWQSFLLEASGFLATWFVLDALASGVEALFKRNRRKT